MFNSEKNKMKRTFLEEEIQEKGLNFIKETLKNSKFKEISFEGR
jgi:hypothetical protein